MKILIATGLFPPDIGGPAQYAKHLYDEFVGQGHAVDVVSFRRERNLPQGIRHFFYFVRVLPYVRKCDYVIAMDTFSVGFPSVLAAMLFGKKTVIRIGGDFLWESYIEKRKKPITLKQFNERMPNLFWKEKIIFHISKFTMQEASALAFNSEWQKNIFKEAYHLDPKQLFVVENFYGEKMGGHNPSAKNFLWAGRPLTLKNTDMLRRVFESAREKRSDISLEMITNMRYEDLLSRMRDCYAVILPSISDVHPNFIIDALSMNKPFIMTRETGLYERLRDVGIFIDPFDENDLIEKILFLADDVHYQEYKKKVGNFNFRHEWKDVAGAFLNIYHKV